MDFWRGLARAVGIVVGFDLGRVVKNVRQDTYHAHVSCARRAPCVLAVTDHGLNWIPLYKIRQEISMTVSMAAKMA
jgi:hypothetical protein